jgi:hypothetical protein
MTSDCFAEKRMTTTEYPQFPAPLCVLDALDDCAPDDRLSFLAIAILLLSEPQLVGQIQSVAAVEQSLRRRLDPGSFDETREPSENLILLLALSHLLNKSGRIQEANSFYYQAIDTIMSSSADPKEISTLAQEFDEMLRRVGQEDAARTVRHRLQVQRLMAQTNESRLCSLRNLAFDAFVAGDCAEAERIYRYLLLHQFEIAGTHCHLARILLMTNRFAEAGEVVELAWQNRANATPYVIVRIHFFRALLATLAGQDVAEHLSALTASMDIPGSHSTWLMTPVLDALRPQLTTESQAFFARLADTMSDRAN